MAARSGSFVPPTAGSSGCSQKRVTASGRTDHASKRLRDRGDQADDAARRRAAQPPSSFCFCASNWACVMVPFWKSVSSLAISSATLTGPGAAGGGGAAV